jgi:hypothetical protein
MIERTTFGFDVTCDELECNYDESVDTDDFMSVIQHMKDNDWRIYQDADGEWMHECPACKEVREESKPKSFVDFNA